MVGLPKGGESMNVSGVSAQAQFQSLQQPFQSVGKAVAQQAASAATTQKPDGDGDHGVESQSGATSGAKTGQLLNALA